MTDEQAQAIVGVFMEKLSQWAEKVSFSPWASDHGGYVTIDGDIETKALAGFILAAAEARPS